MTICALGGIDMALWDVYAQSLGVPIYKLLGGGYRDRIPAYASGGHAPPEHAGEEAMGYMRRGFKAMKMRVGGMDANNAVVDAVVFGRAEAGGGVHCPDSGRTRGNWARRSADDRRPRLVK